MPDRTTEPGPSEQPPETGHPNEGSQTDDEFTVMDVEEEQPEDEAPQPPRKRGRFENERSDSTSQGEGASQQHHEGEEPMTKAQRKRERQRKEGPPRKPRDDFRRRRADKASWSSGRRSWSRSWLSLHAQRTCTCQSRCSSRRLMFVGPGSAVCPLWCQSVPKKQKNNKTTEDWRTVRVCCVRGAYAEFFIPKPKGTFGCKAADCVHATSNLMRALDFHSIRGHSIAGYGVTLCTVAPMQRGS